MILLPGSPPLHRSGRRPPTAAWRGRGAGQDPAHAAASVFEYHPDKAKDAVRSVLAKKFDEKAIWEHKPSDGDPHVRITGLSADAYTGEVVEIDHRVIHLCLLKTN
jgi:hypothetical protein